MLNRLQIWGNWLRADPVGFLIFLLYFAVAILASLILHEVAHGYVAYRCGDPTAKMLGRLSLDPRKHLDPIGTACLVLLGFGWAKPVPVNPHNFRRGTRDDFLVSIAGVTVNFTLFLLSILIATLLNPLLWRPEAIQDNGGAASFLSSSGIGYAVLVNGEGKFNEAFMLHPWLQHIQRFLLMFGTMNLGLAVFNLLPIPPLDGFHVVNDLLLRGRLSLNRQFFDISRFLLLVLCFTGLLGNILSVITRFIEGGVLHLLLLVTGQA